MEIIKKKDKNGRDLYYHLDRNGKLRRISAEKATKKTPRRKTPIRKKTPRRKTPIRRKPPQKRVRFQQNEFEKVIFPEEDVLTKKTTFNEMKFSPDFRNIQVNLTYGKNNVEYMFGLSYFDLKDAIPKTNINNRILSELDYEYRRGLVSLIDKSKIEHNIINEIYKKIKGVESKFHFPLELLPPSAVDYEYCIDSHKPKPVIHAENDYYCALVDDDVESRYKWIRLDESFIPNMDELREYKTLHL